MSEETKRNSPQETPALSWIDIPFVTEVLINAGKEVDIAGISLNNATAVGDNYGSYMHRVTINLADGSTQSLLIKEVRYYTGEKDGYDVVFNREHLLMAELIPKMEALLEGAGSQSRLSARLYDRGSKPNLWLALEDLRPLDFKMADRCRGLGLRHSLLALRSLARFHAASRALLEKEPALVDELFNIWDEEKIAAFTRPGIRATAKACAGWPGFEEYSKLLEAYENVFPQKFINATSPRPGEFHVIVHGDFWVNNLMFRYDEEGQPCDMRMVDLQISHVASPAVDILYFLTASTSEDVYLHHQDLLLREYYFALQESMSLLELQAPTMGELLQSLEEHGPVATFITFIGLPNMKTGIVFDMDATVSGAEPTNLNPLEHPIARRWLQRMLPDFKRRGWLSTE